MLRYAASRLISALVTAWLVASLVFVSLRLIPGDPATSIAGPEATPGQVDHIRRSLGLDDPIVIQYGRFLADIGRLNFGTSIRNGQSVMAELKDRLPATLELTLSALLLVILVSIPLGSIAAIRRGSPFDHIARLVTLVGVGMPVFWSGLLIAWLFAYELRLLPGSGRLDVMVRVEPITGFVIVDSLLRGQPDIALNALAHLVLPVIVLAIPGLAIATSLMRGSLLQVLG
ncbi:MAG: ABC transporter permease, partial [Chloroflexota bacterium]|nr:ABC transporter permease [Chloroflexota bacterium]